MYGIANKLAKYHQQEKATAQGRWIWREEDFTAQDLEEVKATTKRIIETLKSCNGLPWWDDFTIENGKMVIHQRGALSELGAILPGTFIGFKMQDHIIARCKKHGIIFREV